MKVLVVGSGGREHALAWKLRQSPLVKEIIVAPGNGGTALEAENVPLKDDDLPGLISLAKERKVDLVVPGPELPLVLGLCDALARESIPCFGPNAFAANLEGSKAFSKTTMLDSGVPSAPFQVFDEFDRARAFVMEKGAPIVVKADGLAAGKGVIVCQTVDEALAALDDSMNKKVFGSAGDRVVVEECMQGEEASFLAFCSGTEFALLPSSQDQQARGRRRHRPQHRRHGRVFPGPGARPRSATPRLPTWSSSPS